MKGYPDPSGLQQQVDNIMGHPARARRGTTNGNARGGSEDRRKRELCPRCFPGQTHNGAAPGEPEEVSDRDAL